jgi:phage baseplate assembly protein W
MMVDITAKLDQIDFGATGITEILQNIRTILTTAKYSVPIDREFGLSATMLDDPTPIAQAKLTAEIIAAVNRWEPRAQVKKVTFEVDDTQGILRPKVQVKIKNG